MPSATQSDVTTPIHTKNSGGRRRIVFRLVIWTYSAKRINAMHVRATVNSIHERLYLVRRIRPIATMAATIPQYDGNDQQNFDNHKPFLLMTPGPPTAAPNFMARPLRRARCGPIAGASDIQKKQKTRGLPNRRKTKAGGRTTACPENGTVPETISKTLSSFP